MAVSAGTMLFKGVSGKTYSVDLYIPDAVATNVTFNGSGKATSTSNAYWNTPEAGFIVDVSTPASPTAVGAIITKDGAQVTNGCIRWANQLNTLATRPSHAIPVSGNVQLGLLQF